MLFVPFSCNHTLNVERERKKVKISLDESGDVVDVFGCAARMIGVGAQDDDRGCWGGKLHTLQPIFDSHRLF